MFARCPDCQKTQELTVEQLRMSRGMLRCVHCSSMFDALSSLSETEETEAAVETVEPFPQDQAERPRNRFWGAGLAVGIALLLTQIVYFEGYALTQKPGFRAWAEKLCAPLHCRLPVYRNISEFEVLHRSLTVLPNQNYAFRIVFSNQAAFRQPYPGIDLTLIGFDGRKFAHRLLSPDDYLSGASKNSMIEAEATAEINLTIAAPATKVGGFDFDFTF